MVNLSNNAAALIRTLVADSELPGAAALRLGTDDASHALEMDLAAVPHEHDVVVEHDGAALWVSPRAAAHLGDRTLQAQLEPRPAFFVD